MSNAPFCPNCYHPNPSEYCPQCGQKQAERRQSVRQLFTDFLDDQFGVNRRLPRTLKLLLFKPGFLTSEYFDGRVNQYIAPVRLYLLTSLIFFAVFLMSSSNNISVEKERREFQEEVRSDTALQRQLRERGPRGPMIGVRLDPSDTTNWLQNPDVNLGWKPLNEAAKRRIREFSVYGEDEGTRRLIKAVIAQMPTVFFLLMPVYAFLLWLFFRKQRKFYVEHFIAGLHLHAFGFLALLPTAVLGLPFLPRTAARVGDIISPFILFWIVIYIFFALRRIYRQGWAMTGLKYFFLWFLYVLFFTFGIIMSGAFALMA